MDEEVLE